MAAEWPVAMRVQTSVAARFADTDGVEIILLVFNTNRGENTFLLSPVVARDLLVNLRAALE